MPDRTRIEGVRPILEALRAGRRRVHRIELSEGDGSPGLRELRTLAEERSVPVSAGRGGRSRARAIADPYPEESFESLLGAPGPRFLIALDRVTDVGNLGSIARTADAAGAIGLILEHHHAPPIGEGALRASAGALEHLRLGRTPNLARALALARDEGIAVLGAEVGAPPLSALAAEILRGDLIWVFGSEDRGLRPAIRRQLDAAVGIPELGRVASLGVAAAAAYLLLRTSEVRASKSRAGVAKVS
jgi:23S rRNA (guanosine2251-2'-O)-methyltransferase